MKKFLRRLVYLFLFVGAVLSVLGLLYGHTVTASLHGANGFATKWVCSEVFVTGLSLDQAMDDLPDNPLLPLMRPHLDREAETVTLSVAGLFARSAVHRDGFGCTLIPPGSTVDDLASVPEPGTDVLPSPTTAEAPDSAPAPDGEEDGSVPTEKDEAPAPKIDREALDRAVALAFAEPEPKRPKETRAVLVVYDGEIVAERYAPGFKADTPLTGWSMTKSWTHTLIGLAVERGLVDIHADLDMPDWPEQDPRRELTLDHLLRMSSGLDFEEDYAKLDGDAVQMLFVGRDSGSFALAKPLAQAPDTRWYYSSGTTNAVSLLLRRAFPSDDAYLSFPRSAFFEPLGMESALIEPDPSGTFVGSSFGWATARDWAKFGRLYLQDGVWNGERLLPEGWVRYAATPTPAAPRGRYGAHFWLNAGTPENPDDRPMPSLPTDLLMASGFNGQHVVIAPSKNAVIVRLGLSRKPTTWDLETFLGPVLDALPSVDLIAPETTADAAVEAASPSP